ncbi:hypothetical protein ACE1CA_28065 [Aerosakkonemataceae cyanobacterium BLCC-F167]|uniref:Uncharacterized protein n=1 Tax=Floridaenema evergladense BLCC-F167 TaxID=3153639 RepID=A0ABV4WUR4_9CYAN
MGYIFIIKSVGVACRRHIASFATLTSTLSVRSIKSATVLGDR